jgi:hypothetical protein
MRVHGHDRGGELRDAIKAGTAKVVEHLGRSTGYATPGAIHTNEATTTRFSIETLAAPLVCLTPEKWCSGIASSFDVMSIPTGGKDLSLRSMPTGGREPFINSRRPSRSNCSILALWPRALISIHMRSLTFGYIGAIEAKRWVKVACSTTVLFTSIERSWRRRTFCWWADWRIRVCARLLIFTDRF